MGECAASVVVGIAALLLAHAHREDRFPDGNEPAYEADDQHGRERDEHHVGGGPGDEINPDAELPQGQRDQRCHQHGGHCKSESKTQVELEPLPQDALR